MSFRGLGLGLAVAVWWGGAATASAQSRCAAVPVEGTAIHACVQEGGAGAVVLAAGAGQASGTWRALAAELSHFTTVITFDRPGLGNSAPGVTPRTPTRIARELGTVLSVLDPDEPVVLVGHSMGGLHALRYAVLFPSRVHAVVLVDTPPPNFEQTRMELLDEHERRERMRLLTEGLERLPESVRLEREGAEDATEWDLAGFPDHLPLVVIVADSQHFGDLGSQEAHRRAWVARSRDWLQLSSESEFVLARGSGHMVHQECSVLVAEQIRRLLRGRGQAGEAEVVCGPRTGHLTWER